MYSNANKVNTQLNSIQFNFNVQNAALADVCSAAGDE